MKLFRLAIEPDEEIKWHSYATAENSSQVLCLNAFGSLRHSVFDHVRNKLVAEFVTGAFDSMATDGRPRRWSIGVEVENPDLLGEHGGGTQSTSIDALLTTTEDVVTLEAKFDSDAQNGFGSCSQPGAKKCSGNYGPGSDLKGGTSAFCRLENWDGLRSPRLYWALGKRFFQPALFQPGRKCAFASYHYQLMRNFLFAAAYATQEGKRRFGMLIVCPKERTAVVRRQLETIQNGCSSRRIPLSGCTAEL
jgi:hypothetical protein